MQEDESFWEEYDAAHDTLSWNQFKETEVYKIASEARRESSKWSRLALNAPTQGSGIIILKEAISNFFKYLVENKLFGIVLLCDLIHDECCIEYPNTMPEMAKILVKFMEEASAKYCTKLACIQVNGIGIFAWTHRVHNSDTYVYSHSVYRCAHRQIQPPQNNGSGSGILHASGICYGLSGAFQFNRCMAYYSSQPCIWGN